MPFHQLQQLQYLHHGATFVPLWSPILSSQLQQLQCLHHGATFLPLWSSILSSQLRKVTICGRHVANRFSATHTNRWGIIFLNVILPGRTEAAFQLCPVTQITIILFPGLTAGWLGLGLFLPQENIAAARDWFQASNLEPCDYQARMPRPLRYYCLLLVLCFAYYVMKWVQHCRNWGNG